MIGRYLHLQTMLSLKELLPSLTTLLSAAFVMLVSPVVKELIPSVIRDYLSSPSLGVDSLSLLKRNVISIEVKVIQQNVSKQAKPLGKRKQPSILQWVKRY